MKDHNPSSRPDAPNEPVAISLDDWSVQPVSLDEWNVAPPSSENAALAEPQPIALDDWNIQPISIDDWAVPIETESNTEEKTVIDPDLQAPAKITDPQDPTPKPAEDLEITELDDSFTEPDITADDDLAPAAVVQPSPDLNEDDLPLNTEEEEVNLPLSEEHLDLEGPIDFSEELFDDEPQVIPTPTRTIAYDASREVSHEGDSDDELSKTNHALLTKEEDLGLDIDDLELPGTDSGHFELESEEPVHSTNFDSDLPDDDLLFDPPTTVTIQETHPLSEAEEEELNNQSKIVKSASNAISTTPLVALEETDLLAEDAVVKVQDQDLTSDSEPLVVLTELDLAEAHQLSVVQLQPLDLREQNILPVIKLTSNDLATNHRVVMELTLDFFENNGIERDEYGVILLSTDDLANQDSLNEDETETVKKIGKSERKKKTIVRSESKWDDQRIIKACLMAIAFFLIAIPSIFYFKFSWVTIPDARYEEIKEKASGFDWYTETMFRYRTQDGGWHWFGRQKLNSHAYEKASEEDAMAWLKYSNSGKSNVGDSLD